MLTLLEVLWWVVLFPVLGTLVVNVYWRRKLQTHKGPPPYASIAGFVLGGWYGFVVTFCVLARGNFLLLFNFPRTPGGIQREVGAEFLCALVGLATAFGGRLLANRLTGADRKPEDANEQADSTDTQENLNSI